MDWPVIELRPSAVPERGASGSKFAAETANTARACPLARRFGLPRQIVARREHVVQRSERVHVMSGEPFTLDPPEHIGKIEVAGAGLQMDFVAIAEAIRQPHLLDPAHLDRI